MTLEDFHAFPHRLLDFLWHCDLAGKLTDRATQSENHVRSLAASGGRDIMRGLAENGWFWAVLFVNLGDVADPARDGRDVERGIAPAQHDDLAGDGLEPPFVEGAQEREAGDAIRRIEAGDRQAQALVGAEPPKNGVEVLFEFGNREVSPDARVEHDFDAHCEDAIDFPVQHLARGAIAGNAETRHATKRVVIVEHGDGVPRRRRW